jgi:hypothetical protein
MDPVGPQQFDRIALPARAQNDNTRIFQDLAALHGTYRILVNTHHACFHGFLPRG